MDNSMSVYCEQCKKYKIRLTKTVNSRKYFCSPKGKLWRRDSVCSDCNAAYRREKMGIKRSLKRIAIEEDECLTSIPRYHTMRTCRSCTGLLETSRWITCLTCRPTLPSIDESFIYYPDAPLVF